jgi:hypothetical protein
LDPFRQFGLAHIDGSQTSLLQAAPTREEPAGVDDDDWQPLTWDPLGENDVNFVAAVRKREREERAWGALMEWYLRTVLASVEQVVKLRSTGGPTAEQLEALCKLSACTRCGSRRCFGRAPVAAASAATAAAADEDEPPGLADESDEEEEGLQRAGGDSSVRARPPAPLQPAGRSPARFGQQGGAALRSLVRDVRALSGACCAAPCAPGAPGC